MWVQRRGKDDDKSCEDSDRQTDGRTDSEGIICPLGLIQCVTQKAAHKHGKSFQSEKKRLENTKPTEARVSVCFSHTHSDAVVDYSYQQRPQNTQEEQFWIFYRLIPLNTLPHTHTHTLFCFSREDLRRVLFKCNWMKIKTLVSVRTHLDTWLCGCSSSGSELWPCDATTWHNFTSFFCVFWVWVRDTGESKPWNFDRFPSHIRERPISWGLYGWLWFQRKTALNWRLTWCVIEIRDSRRQRYEPHRRVRRHPKD